MKEKRGEFAYFSDESVTGLPIFLLRQDRQNFQDYFLFHRFPDESNGIPSAARKLKKITKFYKVGFYLFI